MCDADIPRTCKQRFKGIENFLRRVAFNLGNTPSQTEVKIISCIPIDVTDLQQKIISLEKELHDAKENKSNKSSCQPCPSCKTGKTTGVFNTALATSVSGCCSGSKTKLSRRSHHSSQCDNYGLDPKQSNISFVFSALTLAEQKENPQCSNKRNKNSAEQKASDKGKGLFRRRKKKSKVTEGSRPNNPLVYYAETSHIPFFDMHSTYIPNTVVATRKRDVLSAHLSNVMRKQYDPKFGLEELSDTSAFSRPVCRDLANALRYDSDVCSCCHGRFQNVDDYMQKDFNYLIDSGQSHGIDYTSSNKTYYDSDLYDIVPVKETTNKIKHDNSKDKTKKYIDINCWPETIRTKHRTHPVSMSYRAEIPTKHRYYKQTEPKAENHRQLLSNSRRQRLFNLYNNMNEATSKSCSIECGIVYTKPILQQSPKSIEIVPKKNKEAPRQRENQAMQIDSNDSQVKKCKSIQLGVNLITDNNTEMLEQIKSILQSVLAEVKTNTQLNKEETSKKDAVVQKGSSQNNMPGCSTLLHSLTYNTSHNANSYYTPYTPHLPQGPLCYASFPYQHNKCMQNLQYLLNPCHRHHSSCQNRNTNQTPLSKPVNASINTERKAVQSTSKETNNLIKDIYKSVALNMNFPMKDSSKSDYADLRSSGDVSTNKSQTKDDLSTYESDVIKSDKEIEAFLSSATNIASPTTHYTETSSQSEYKCVTKETATVDIKDTRSSSKSNRQSYNLYRFEGRNMPKPSKKIADDCEATDESSSEEESDDTVVPSTDNDKVTKQRRGLFQRFFKSVKMLRRRRIPSTQGEQEEPSEDSETEEYETYSESIQQSQSQYRGTPVKPIKKSPPINIQLNGKRISRSPYMEQEDRREWTETFQERQGYCEKPGTSRSLRNKHYYSPYRKSYEVRSVVTNATNDRDDVSHDCRLLNTNGQDNDGKEKLSFLKKHKLLKCRCGERFKKLILDN